jgi:glycosyltransferase involved in cell wall biosynthesis
MTPTPGLVRVLLSTYNSARFIQPLLDSVLAQAYAPLELWVRDDGSKDETPAILAEYARRFPGRVHVDADANVGMVRSYFKLIRDAGREAEFTAFADHDDVWHTDKIERAVAMLRAHGGAGPLMYTGRLHIVDEALGHLGYSNLPSRPMTFRNALVESVAAGCTMVLSPAARDLILDTQDISRVCWPDAFFYLVVSAFGTVLYDEHAAVEYRRHTANAVGSPSRWSPRWLRDAWHQLRDGRLDARFVDQASTLRDHFGARLPAGQRAILDSFLAPPGPIGRRVWRALTCPVYRQRPVDGLFVRLLILTRSATS